MVVPHSLDNPSCPTSPRGEYHLDSFTDSCCTQAQRSITMQLKASLWRPRCVRTVWTSRYLALALSSGLHAALAVSTLKHMRWACWVARPTDILMHYPNLGPHSAIMHAAEPEPYLSVGLAHVSMRTRLSRMHPVNTLQASSATSYFQTGALLAQRLRTAGHRALQHALSERQHPSRLKVILELSAACTKYAHARVEGWRACWTLSRRLHRS